ncbi:hypothetical protein [Pandoraea oxalativorans]|nr:hypothetical protein [Pandoraea oxalativorans]
MLEGTTPPLGVHGPGMGVIVGVGSIMDVGMTAMMALYRLAPAARRGKLRDTRPGGPLVDAFTCNPVVKACGAESRKEARLERVISKWRAAHSAPACRA